MEVCLRHLGFMKFLQNNNYQADNEMNWKSKNTVKNRWDFVGIV